MMTRMFGFFAACGAAGVSQHETAAGQAGSDGADDVDEAAQAPRPAPTRTLNKTRNVLWLGMDHSLNFGGSADAAEPDVRHPRVGSAALPSIGSVAIAVGLAAEEGAASL
jgi:hypothetical protein